MARMKVSPDHLTAIQASLDSIVKPLEKAEAAIEAALKIVEDDLAFPTLEEMEKAMKKVVVSLIGQFPNDGFEAWRPKQSGKSVGSRWREILEHLEAYYDRHTASGR